MFALTVGASYAQAQTTTTEQQQTTTGTTTTAAPAVQPVQAAPVVQAPAPVQAVPAATGPTKSRQVNVETHSENYMLTVAKSTFFGAVAGAIIGGAIYFIDRDNVRPVTVAYWASGGALVGAAAGVIQVAVSEGRTERATSSLMEQRTRRATGVAFVPQLVNVKF
jgi:hypothetical protein